MAGTDRERRIDFIHGNLPKASRLTREQVAYMFDADDDRQAALDVQVMAAIVAAVMAGTADAPRAGRMGLDTVEMTVRLDATVDLRLLSIAMVDAVRRHDAVVRYDA